jgi:hypothetical protein
MDPSKIKVITGSGSRVEFSLDIFANHLDGQILGVPVHRESYGWCRPHKIILSRGDKVFYFWDKQERTDEARRIEYFFGRQFRSYEGDQFCFLEYCQACIAEGRILAEEELREVLPLKIARRYRRALERVTAN